VPPGDQCSCSLLCFHDRHLILRTIFLSPLLQICTVLYFAEIVPVLLYVVPRQLQTADCRVLFPDFCSCSPSLCWGFLPGFSDPAALALSRLAPPCSCIACACACACASALPLLPHSCQRHFMYGVHERTCRSCQELQL
jgi:hypothetical protein